MTFCVNIGPAVLVDGSAYDAEAWHRSHVATLGSGQGGAVQIRPGVFQGACQMGVQPGRGMSVQVDGGSAIVPSPEPGKPGSYLATLMQGAGLAVATSDATSPRVDAVCVTVTDPGTSSASTVVSVLVGTPTAGATAENLAGAPVLPAGSLVLAYVLVPAGATSIAGGDIADRRTYTVAPGGILPLLALVPARVDPDYSGGNPCCYVNGSAALSAPCGYLAGYAPAAGDLVLVAPTPIVGPDVPAYVILGRLAGAPAGGE